MFGIGNKLPKEVTAEEGNTKAELPLVKRDGQDPDYERANSPEVELQQNTESDIGTVALVGLESSSNEAQQKNLPVVNRNGQGRAENYTGRPTEVEIIVDDQTTDAESIDVQRAA